jgi:hypothetical protein
MNHYASQQQLLNLRTSDFQLLLPSPYFVHCSKTVERNAYCRWTVVSEDRCRAWRICASAHGAEARDAKMLSSEV